MKCKMRSLPNIATTEHFRTKELKKWMEHDEILSKSIKVEDLPTIDFHDLDLITIIIFKTSIMTATTYAVRKTTTGLN